MRFTLAEHDDAGMAASKRTAAVLKMLKELGVDLDAEHGRKLAADERIERVERVVSQVVNIFQKEREMPNNARSRLVDALRAKFPGGPKEVMKTLGLDSALLKDLSGRSPSRTMRDDKDMIGNIRQMENMTRSEQLGLEEHAQHGRSDLGIDDDWQEKARAFMSDCGLSEDDQNALFEMLPTREHIRGEKVERGTKDEEELDREEAQQRRLEGSERRVAPEHSRENAEASSREARNSLQRETTRDEMPRRSRNYLPENHMSRRMAGDADLAAMRQEMMRLPASGGRNPTAAELRVSKSKVSASLALDGKARDRLVERYGEHFGRITIPP